MTQLLLLCRPGFEPECAAEAAAGCGPGARVVHARPRSGWVLVEVPAAPGDWRVPDCVFARQGFWVTGRLALPKAAPGVTDVVSAVQAGLPDGAFSAVLGEAPDSESGRPLWPLCEKIAGAVQEALAASRRFRPGSGRPRLHLFVSETGEGFLGVSGSGGGAPWPMGIPRLRKHRKAPSRSALKLEEAFLRFLPAGSLGQRVRAGMRAVDLGAAPGGWTWELARRGVVVTAVDNGPMDPELFDLGLVTHLRTDGFAHRPQRPVDWMVCDMAAPPGRVARLVGSWGAHRSCRESIFNLKLPMKRRLAELQRCEGVLRQLVEGAGVRYELRFKHLYHDREEVTGHLRILPPSGRRKTSGPRGGKARLSQAGRRPRR